MSFRGGAKSKTHLPFERRDYRETAALLDASEGDDARLACH